MSNISSPSPELDRDARIRRVVEEVLLRRAAGEDVSDAELLLQHGELLPELASELRKLAVIGRARELSASGNQEREANAIVEETQAHTPRTLSRSLHIHCPLCHEPLDIAVDQPLDNLNCVACGERFSLAADDERPGDKPAVMRIDRFELIERLGIGGFGSVWRARDTELDRTVALKVPRQGQLSADEVVEFLHEAKIAARLKHPNIVPVHQIGRDGDNVFIISDLIDGQSLARFKDKNRMSHREAAALLATLCDALHFAHEQGVVHRDLKPGNILLAAEGVPHITDFGLAVRLTDGVAINEEGDILGTPAYMSPEQARGDAHLSDCRTDIYALGVILFELLTDFLPFRGNVVMLTHHAVHTQPPSPRSLNSSIPLDLETICLKCLEKNPAKRYATAKDLGDELRRFLNGDAILARPISAPAHLWRWMKRNPRIPVLSASLLLVVLFAYAIAWLRFESIYAASDRALTQQALSNVQFTAQSIADTAGRDLEQYFQVIEQAARDAPLPARLKTLEDRIQQDYPGLSDPAQSDAQLQDLRNKLEVDAERVLLRKWLEEQRQQLPGFAWFVLLADGLQVARDPETRGGEQTIGRNYAWRAYYHGGQEDKKEAWRPVGDAERLAKTHLSPAFVSRYTNQWVVVISAPIHDEQQKFCGVLGLMVQLGSFAKLPGNEQPGEGDKNPENRFAVLVDARPPNPGQILQHPLYQELSDDAAAGQSQSPRRQLLDHSQDAGLRVLLADWVTHDAYRDPFGASSSKYEQHWLAAKLPVKVRGQETGLLAIVQESRETLIGTPLGQLRRGVVLLSVLTFGLSAAVIIPLWVMILRLVR